MRIQKTILVVILAGALTLPTALFAQDLGEIGTSAGFSGASIFTIIANIIRVIVGLLGVVMLGLMIYSGIMWMTAGGDEEKVLKAKQTMVRAIIGFAVVLMSMAFVTFIMNAFGIGGIFGRGDQNPGPGAPPLSNSLGNGGIVDHYPMRDQIGIPRNTRVIVTFKGVVSPAMFIDGLDDGGTPADSADDTMNGEALGNEAPLDTGMVKIYRTEEGQGEAFAGEQVNVGYSIIDTGTIQTSTFIFMMPILDGLADYSVYLDDAIEDIGGASLIDNGGYLWTFTTSDQLDLTPPQVQYVVPLRDRTYGRNIAIQMTFNEPMDPASVSGLFVPGEGGEFTNIEVTSSGITQPIEGVYMISNGYRTVTYLTNDACGTNSCGQSIFCLPANSDITTRIKSPTPLDAARGAQVPANPYPPQGATDIVGNALDGNGDGTIQVGTDRPDDYRWGFSTNNQIVLEGPRIDSIQPVIGQEQVALDEPIEISFDDTLLAASVLPGVSILFAPSPFHELWFVTRIARIDESKDKVQIPHGVLLESTNELTYNYELLTLEKIQNQYQNCFIPSAGPKSQGITCTQDASGDAEPTTCCIPTATEPYCCDGVPSSTSCLPRS